jgi:hypothetical protein
VLSWGSTSPPAAMLPAPRIELHLVAEIPEIGARPGDLLILQVGRRAILRKRLQDRMRSRTVRVNVAAWARCSTAIAKGDQPRMG